MKNVIARSVGLFSFIEKKLKLAQAYKAVIARSVGLFSFILGKTIDVLIQE